MNYSEYSTYEDKRSNGFTTASLVLGIVGIATGCCVYTGIICGALAIIFALLSRGGEKTLSPKAKVGLALGIVGSVSSIFMIIAAFAVVIAEFGSFGAYMDNFMEYYFELMEPYMSTYPNTL